VCRLALRFICIALHCTFLHCIALLCLHAITLDLTSKELVFRLLFLVFQPFCTNLNSVASWVIASLTFC